MTTRLEYTEFRYVNSLYTPLNRESIALHSCSIAFDTRINLITEVMILYLISKRLVGNDYKLKITIPARAYPISEFNQKLKISKPNWVFPKIEAGKLIIMEHHIFVASTPLFDALRVTDKSIIIGRRKFSLYKGEYQKNLKPPPKKVTLYCEEIDNFPNKIDS